MEDLDVTTDDAGGDEAVHGVANRRSGNRRSGGSVSRPHVGGHPPHTKGFVPEPPFASRGSGSSAVRSRSSSALPGRGRMAFHPSPTANSLRGSALRVRSVSSASWKMHRTRSSSRGSSPGITSRRKAPRNPGGRSGPPLRSRGAFVRAGAARRLGRHDPHAVSIGAHPCCHVARSGFHRSARPSGGRRRAIAGPGLRRRAMTDGHLSPQVPRTPGVHGPAKCYGGAIHGLCRMSQGERWRRTETSASVA